MLDALPYLIDYPYGCTEQTMSRFLPAAITAKTLRDLGLKPEDRDGQDLRRHRTSRLRRATHPKGKHDLKELDAITRQSLERLYNFQHADGGWGWWKDGDSDHFMTAYVLWGMTLARQAGIEVKPDVARRARRVTSTRNWSKKKPTTTSRPGCFTRWLSITRCSGRMDRRARSAQFQVAKLSTISWTNRDRLNAYTRALLALSAHNFGYRRQSEDAGRESGKRREDRFASLTRQSCSRARKRLIHR